MSNADRNTLKIICLIMYAADQGHFAAYKDDIYQMMWTLSQEYNQGKIGNAENLMAEFQSFYQQIEYDMEQQGINSSTIMMLSLLCMLAEHFLIFVKHPPRVELWTGVLEYCREKLTKNYMQFPDEIEKAENLAIGWLSHLVA